MRPALWALRFMCSTPARGDQLDEAFASIGKAAAPTLSSFLGEPFFDSQRTKIVALSARYGLAGCSPCSANTYWRAVC